MDIESIEQQEAQDQIAKNDQNLEKQDQQQEDVINNEEKEVKEKKQKKKKKKKKKEEEEELTDYETELHIKMEKAEVQKLPNIDQFQKNRLAQVECNPFTLIIDKLPPRSSEQEITEYFNVLITTAHPELSNPAPVLSLEFGENKQYGAITFSTKEAKHAIKNYVKEMKVLDYQGGFQMTIVSAKAFFKKYVDIKINGDLDKQKEEQDKQAAQEEEEEQKIYMGGLPTYLTEEQVKKIAETYGELKFFSLIKDQQNQDESKFVSKGYCFFQYKMKSQTEKAIKGLNGLAVADRKLKVQRASVGQQKLAMAQRGGGGDAQKAANHTGSYLGSCEQIKNQYVQQMLVMPESTRVPSTVIQLLNMVSPEDLVEDDTFEELQEDIQSECSKFGPIESVVIPRPDALTGLCSPSTGKVFVKFKYLLPAKKARHNLSGRTYNKRTVVVSFYPEEKFRIKDYLINY